MCKLICRLRYTANSLTWGDCVVVVTWPATTILSLFAIVLACDPELPPQHAHIHVSLAGSPGRFHPSWHTLPSLYQRETLRCSFDAGMWRHGDLIWVQVIDITSWFHSCRPAGRKVSLSWFVAQTTAYAPLTPNGLYTLGLRARYVREYVCINSKIRKKSCFLDFEKYVKNTLKT